MLENKKKQVCDGNAGGCKVRKVYVRGAKVRRLRPDLYARRLRWFC